MNGLVTLLHIIVVSASAITAFLLFINYNISSRYKLNLTIALEFFTALQDIFLSYNFFFILNESERPDIIRDENRSVTYPLLDVIKAEASRISTSIENDLSSSSTENSEEEEEMPLGIS